MTIFLFGLKFSSLSSSEIAKLVTDEQPDPKPGLVVTANIDHISNLSIVEKFRDAYRSARIITIDGKPLLGYARLRGYRDANLVTGSDLLPQIILNLDPTKHRLAFLASTEETCIQLKRILTNMGFNSSQLLLISPPFGFESNQDVNSQLVFKLQDFSSTHIFLGVGSPKSEIWAHANQQSLSNAWIFCFGAGIDFFAGTKKRAPAFLRSLSLEWLWRIFQEPRRLAKRYFVSGSRFMYLVLFDLWN